MHAPLTGIGRYSLELGRRLEKHLSISDIRYFSLGRWVDDPLPKLLNGDVSATVKTGVSLKIWLAGNNLAVNSYNALSPIFFAWRLRELTAQDVYHAPNFFVPSCKAQKVVTVHDLSHEVHPECHPTARVQLMKMALPRSLAEADHVITVSETVRGELIERFNLNPRRVTATLLAADAVYRPHNEDMLTPAMTALGLRAGRYCLFVGTVEPRKNVRRLVEAYALLPQYLRDQFPLVIAGGAGWNSTDIHDAIVRGVAQGWLRYLSYVEQKWLPSLYAGARLMAYPSLYEGFGLPIVEAMASGTPVLTSNVSCMPEVAAGAARLVNPLDVDHIANALEECLTDELWQSEAINRGLARAGQLSWDRCADETIAVYQSLL